MLIAGTSVLLSIYDIFYLFMFPHNRDEANLSLSSPEDLV